MKLKSQFHRGYYFSFIGDDHLLSPYTGGNSWRARRAKLKKSQKEAFRVTVLRGEGERVGGAFAGAEATEQRAKPPSVCLRKSDTELWSRWASY